MESSFKKIVFYVNIVVDVIVIGVGLFLLTDYIIKKLNVTDVYFKPDTLKEKIENYQSTVGIKCDELKTNEIMYLGYNYVVFKNGEMYSILNDEQELYSNNQQCKKVDLSFKIKQVLSSYLIDENNNYYQVEYDSNGDIKILVNNEVYGVIKTLVENGNVKDFSSYYNSENDRIEYYVLKTDGNIYEQNYDTKFDEYYGYQISTLVDEKIVLSNEIYGNINGFMMNNSNEIDIIYTSNGIYVLKEIGEDCGKYQDVKCAKELVLSEEYKKFGSEIRYTGFPYSLTNDNVIFDLKIIKKQEL